LTLFKGKMIIHSGGKASAFKNKGDVDSYATDDVNLYHIKGTNPLDTRAVQVPAVAGSLNSGDSFVLQTPQTQYVWFGKHSNEDEHTVAKAIAKVLKGKRASEEVKEGKEAKAFWDFLGGKAAYQEYSEQQEVRDPRLFQCSNASGAFTVEEIFNFQQSDLDNDDVMILDTFNEVFVWIGAGANEIEKKGALETAIEYVNGAGDGRSADTTPVYRVNAGNEPPMFSACFLGWDPVAAGNTGDSYEKAVASLQSASAVLAEYSRTYTYEELKAKPPPATCDATNLEHYLSDAEFATIFKVDRASFAAQPKWKRDNSKKAAGLF